MNVGALWESHHFVYHTLASVAKLRPHRRQHHQFSSYYQKIKILGLQNQYKFKSFQKACLDLCHCTHREILNKVRIGDFAVDVPSQLGRRFGTARSAVDLNFVADVVSRKTSSYYGAFVGEIYRRKKNREHRSQ